MTIVEFTTGLPASGKTTFAKQRVAESGGKLRRVNLDDLRFMLDSGTYTKDLEQSVLKIQDRIVVQAVRDGYNVIVDNTHLHKRVPERIRAALSTYDVTWKVHDFLDVPPDECVRRDKERLVRGERGVGADVIERMARKRTAWRLTEDFLYDYPKPAHYTATKFIRSAVICDIDGTLAHAQGRNPYDASRCGEDLPNVQVAALLRTYRQQGAVIILLSGREDAYRVQTEDWLLRWDIPFDGLLMRPTGDRRRDCIVKAELFDEHIRHQYRVLFALDDRDQVVEMWRSIGVETWQVAEGDF